MSTQPPTDGPTNRTSRRTFLASGAGLAAGATLLGQTAVAQFPSASGAWWSEVDIVVVGSGAAALSAATAAVQAGSSVMILEKAATVGGTTMKSAGGYWVCNNHLMRKKGFTDPKPEAMAFMIEASYPTMFRPDAPRCGIPEPEYRLIETFYDQAAGVIEDLEHRGILKSKLLELYEYHDHSRFDRAPIGRVMVAAGPDGEFGGGRELVRQFRDWLKSKNVPFLVRHEVTEIIKDPQGAVVGVKVRTPDGEKRIRALKGVFFGSGGFTHNERLMRNFQPGPIYGGCAVPTNTGDFVRMGIEAGADLGNMVNAWRAELVVETALEAASVAMDIWQLPGDSMIAVNKYGVRVANEKRNYHERTKIHFVWDSLESEFVNNVTFMVYDRRSAELFAGNYPLPEPGTEAGYVISAPTIEALATAIQQRLDRLAPRIGEIKLASTFPASLKEQIGRYNADAARGTDSQFSRGKYPFDNAWHTGFNSMARKDTQWPQNPGPNVSVYPIETKGPFFAILIGAGNLDTNGGPVTNEKAQVMDTKNVAIPRLYAAGNCIASPAASAYWGGGGTLGLAITYGTLAGRALAAERKGAA